MLPRLFKELASLILTPQERAYYERVSIKEDRLGHQVATVNIAEAMQTLAAGHVSLAPLRLSPHELDLLLTFGKIARPGLKLPTIFQRHVRGEVPIIRLGTKYGQYLYMAEVASRSWYPHFLLLQKPSRTELPYLLNFIILPEKPAANLDFAQATYLENQPGVTFSVSQGGDRILMHEKRGEREIWLDHRFLGSYASGTSHQTLFVWGGKADQPGPAGNSPAEDRGLWRDLPSLYLFLPIFLSVFTSSYQWL